MTWYCPLAGAIRISLILRAFTGHWQRRNLKDRKKEEHTKMH